jgi:anaerobic ribonucleoside-triphosphate reductase
MSSHDFQGFRKRNGMVVPFRIEKIETAISRAAEAVARKEGVQLDDSIASRICRRVVAELNNPLCEYYVQTNDIGERIPKIEDVQDLVEIVLSEEGYSSIVAMYKRYRKQRERARSTIVVRGGAGESDLDVTDASLLLVHSVDRNESLPWDRSRITRQLLEKTQLSDEVAISVAKAVENQVIAGEIKGVTTTLIRELVNNELVERGYGEQLQDLSLYPVPRDFVERLMFTKSTENSNIVNNNPEAVNLGLAELILKQWGLDTIFSSEVKRAHETGAIHLHDLGYPHRVYCSSHSIEYVKKYGLRDIANLNTESKPARSASVLTGHLNTFLASMQANYAGALGIAYINIFYAPYLKGKTRKQMKQVAQELIFNGSQNAFSRGGQTLFLDFNIHTGVPRYLMNVPAIGPGGHYMLRRADGSTTELVEQLRDDTDAAGNSLMNLYHTDENGEERLVLREIFDPAVGITYDQDVAADLKQRSEAIVTYGDYQEEAREFTKALLDVWADGDRSGRVFEFPKCDFHVSDETFKDPKQHEIFIQACELASKNGSTYFVFDRDEVTLSACCRLRTTITDNRMLQHPESMRFCGFQNVTINIPQAMYRASRQGKCTLEGLYEEVDKTMETAVQAHLQKREKIAVMISEPGRPLYQIGRNACDGRPYVELDKCTYILGLIGVNDAINFLIGKELHESDEAMDMGIRLVSHMYLKAKKLSKKYNMKLTLEESPAESAARRLAKTDLVFFNKEASKVVKGDNEDVVYYTNSVHLTAEAPVSLVERIRQQAKYHSLIESGAITHAFVGEEKPSAESIAKLVKDTLFRTQTAQLTISPEFTYCNNCRNNSRGLQEECVQCGSDDVVGETRVVGYFSKIQNWNKSKRYGELLARHRGRYAVETADDQQIVTAPAAAEAELVSTE